VRVVDFSETRQEVGQRKVVWVAAMANGGVVEQEGGELAKVELEVVEEDRQESRLTALEAAAVLDKIAIHSKQALPNVNRLVQGRRRCSREDWDWRLRFEGHREH